MDKDNKRDGDVSARENAAGRAGRRKMLSDAV